MTEKKRTNFLSRVYHASGGRDPNAPEGEGVFFDDEVVDWQDDPQKTIVLLGEALGEILAWLAAGKRGGEGWHLAVARKTVAMVWAMRPDLLDNKSLRELSKERGVNSAHAALSKHVSTFTKAFGHFHRGTKTDKARAAYKKAREEFLSSKEEDGMPVGGSPLK